MKKINIIKKNEDYQRILTKTIPLKGKGYRLYIEKNNLDNYYFGFSIGKKIGCAVVRNKIKRQTKSILDKFKYKNGFNCVVMATKNILNLDYQEMANDLNELVEKGKIKVNHEK